MRLLRPPTRARYCPATCTTASGRSARLQRTGALLSANKGLQLGCAAAQFITNLSQRRPRPHFGAPPDPFWACTLTEAPYATSARHAQFLHSKTGCASVHCVRDPGCIDKGCAQRETCGLD